MIPLEQLDRQLIEDLLLVKFNRGMEVPCEVTLVSIKYNPDNNIIASIKIDDFIRYKNLMDVLISIDEYKILHRQKKLRQIGI
jgi:hypothetical protein